MSLSVFDIASSRLALGRSSFFVMGNRVVNAELLQALVDLLGSMLLDVVN